MDQLENWALNIRWLVGFLTCLGIGSILALIAWVVARVWLHGKRQRYAQERFRERTHWPDGRPRPPMGEGMCDACQLGYDTVYYLPTGRRLCPGCYEQQGPREAGDG
jgi:hypothetical protein